MNSHCRVCALPPLSRPDGDAGVGGGHDPVGGLLEDDAGDGAIGAVVRPLQRDEGKVGVGRGEPFAGDGDGQALPKGASERICGKKSIRI